MKYTQEQEEKALIKEYRALMKKAGILNKAVWIELTDEKTGKVNKVFENPYKKVLRYFMQLPQHQKIWELINLHEGLYGDPSLQLDPTAEAKKENKNDIDAEFTAKSDSGKEDSNKPTE